MYVRLVSSTRAAQSFVEATIEEIGEELTAELLSITPEALTVYIARVSSDRDNKWEVPERLVGYLIRHGHWSPFEHAYLTFEVQTSRAIATQILRHRSMTFQQFSQRYADSTIIEPIELRLEAETNRQSSTEPLFVVEVDYDDDDMQKNLMEMATIDLSEKNPENLHRFLQLKLRSDQLIYNMLREDYNVASETARFFLPLATQTVMYVTGSLRSWIHFLDMREDKDAQKEVRLVAQEIQRIFYAENPILAKALKARKRRWELLQRAPQLLRTFYNSLTALVSYTGGDEYIDETAELLSELKL